MNQGLHGRLERGGASVSQLPVVSLAGPAQELSPPPGRLGVREATAASPSHREASAHRLPPSPALPAATFISARLGGDTLASSTLISPGGILFRHCSMMRRDWRISSTRHRYLRRTGRPTWRVLGASLTSPGRAPAAPDARSLLVLVLGRPLPPPPTSTGLAPGQFPLLPPSEPRCGLWNGWESDRLKTKTAASLTQGQQTGTESEA